MKEINLKNLTLIEARKIPGLTLFNAPNGVAYTGQVVEQVNDGDRRYLTLVNPRTINYGLIKGSADLIGWYRQEGLAIFTAIEIKTTIGRLSPEQEHFINMVRKNGGIAEVVRDPSELRGLFV